MGPAKTVFIARHGERIDFVDPEWAKTAESPHDAPLTETGLAQAEALGKFLKTKQVSHIFVSPFYRTVQTASQVSTQTGVPLKVEAGLSEFLNPDWFEERPKLRTMEQLSKEFPSIDTSYRSEYEPQFPEDFNQVVVRTTFTARVLASKYSGNILLVAHGLICEFSARGLTATGPPPYILFCSLQTCELEDEEGARYRVAGSPQVDTAFMPESIRPVTNM